MWWTHQHSRAGLGNTRRPWPLLPQTVAGMRVIAHKKNGLKLGYKFCWCMLKLWLFHLYCNPWSYRFHWDLGSFLSTREVDQREWFCYYGKSNGWFSSPGWTKKSDKSHPLPQYPFKSFSKTLRFFNGTLCKVKKSLPSRCIQLYCWFCKTNKCPSLLWLHVHLPGSISST